MGKLKLDKPYRQLDRVAKNWQKAIRFQQEHPLTESEKIALREAMETLYKNRYYKRAAANRK